MFPEISKTAYLPEGRPMMVWDGECPFCAFWIQYLARFTGDRIDYVTFQEVHEYFRDIPVKAFEEAVQFIETDGKVYGGLDAAYRSFYYSKKPVYFLHKLYSVSSLFAGMSDLVYHWISVRRPLMYRLTVWFFGKDPGKLKPYGVVWIIGLLICIWIMRSGAGKPDRSYG